VYPELTRKADAQRAAGASPAAPQGRALMGTQPPTQHNQQEVSIMSKKIGRFGPAATKAIKGSDRLLCHVDNDGSIYVTNGCIGYKMTPAEYTAIVQPVTLCDAGNWTIRNGDKTDAETNGLVKIFSDAQATAELAALQRSSLCVNGGKNNIVVAFHDTTKNFAVGYDTKYLAAFPDNALYRTTGPLSLTSVFCNGTLIGVLMPVRLNDKAQRAVTAYFAQPDNDSDYRNNNVRLRAKLNAAEAELAALKAELATLKEQVSAQPAPADKPNPDKIAAQWSGIDGLTVTVKGAQSAAPIVWLTGDTKKHAKAIEAAGGKWSNKRAAYYINVA